MKTQIELKKGCGMMETPKAVLTHVCGKTKHNKKIWYCPTCQSLLICSNEIIEEIDITKNEIVTDCFELGINFKIIMGKINRLKQSIIRSKEKNEICM